MIVDTGCSRTTVRKDLVSPSKVQGNTRNSQIANGEWINCKLAKVELEKKGENYSTEVAVAERLAVPVLLGRDLPIAQHLFNEDLREILQKRQAQQFVVTTRARARRERAEEEQRLQEEALAQGQSRTITEEQRPQKEADMQDVEAVEHWEREVTVAQDKQLNNHDDQEDQSESQRQEPTLGEEFDFSEDLFRRSRPARQDLLRGQRRKANKSRMMSDKEDTSTLSRAQQEDPEVQRWRSEEDPSRVKEKQGVLLRVWRSRNEGTEYEQIVLLEEYRKQVLRMAHALPLAGHLGKQKTAQRILRQFYWPSVFKDVEKYCRQCPECQVVGRRVTGRAPLIPLPIVGELFEKVAMDIVGPLPKTARGHRYILVICDYATRYPEVMPLKRFTAPAVAEQLMELFSRHGVPKEILTDQGTNFTSQLLQELYKMLGVKPVWTTPYHPQMDGLVERFNQTLKQMLRKMIDEEGWDWDKLVPYILFAYREVPQSSTGFSPFEMVYGRDVRGPLDILKEGWIGGKPGGDDIITYVTQIHERLEAAKETVLDNL